MRVLHIGKYSPPFSGGIENFQFDLMAACTQLGVQTAALVHNHRLSLGSKLDFVPMHEQGACLVLRSGTWARLLFAPISPNFGWNLRRIVKQFKPNLIHIHMPNPSAFWSLLPGSPRVPLVVHWHADVESPDSHRLLPLAYRAYRPFEQRLLRRGNRIIATSKPYLEASPALDRWKDKSVVIPLGISAERLKVSDNGQGRSHWVDGNALKLLIVGRLSHYKGHIHLIHAVQQTPGTELVIVGGGVERSRLELAIRHGPRSSSIHLLGHIPDSLRNHLIVSSDLVCLPSVDRGEAFGLAAIEAMGLGRPVLVSDLSGSGLPTLVQQGMTGLKAATGDADSIRSQLVYARDHRNQLVRMGRSAQASYKERFQIQAVAKSIIAVYEEILDESRASDES